MKQFIQRRLKNLAVWWVFVLSMPACSADLAPWANPERSERLRFGAEISLGSRDADPSTPFLRYAPDGRLFAVWTEDHDNSSAQARERTEHHSGSGKMAPSPMRNVYLAASSDGGKTWAPPKRVNSETEAVQGEENGPKVAFDKNSRAYVV